MAEERAQRRLAAILAADVVGYSRLMEQDEVGTLTALKARRKQLVEPLLAKYSGRIFKLTGDGLLAEFSSAVNAVQCAIDLQHAMAAANADWSEDRSIFIRIGVNLGDVIVEGGDRYGDAINVAARLESSAEAAGILISGTTYDHVKGKIKVGFEDLGAQTFKNISEPVRVYRVTDTERISVAAPKIATNRPSIAVLAFHNLSGEPDQQYFSDGIAEDIIADLSRFRWLVVIAPNSSFQFRDKAVDVRRVGRELGVQYLLEGSVRKAGDRLRITAQLIECAAGVHLWSERYDRNLIDLFAIQDDVVRSIVASIAGHVEDIAFENARRKRTEHLGAYDCYLRGLDCDRSTGPNADAESRRWYEKSLELDPNYAEPMAFLAINAVNQGLYSEEADRFERALALARKAVTLDRNNSWGHCALGLATIYGGSLAAAAGHFETAIRLNPNDADQLLYYSAYHLYSGDFDAEHRLVMTAKRLNPFAPAWYKIAEGVAQYFLRHYDVAASLLEGAGSDPHYWVHCYLAACSVRLGRMPEAQRALAKALKLKPNLTVSIYAARLPFAKAEDREHLLEPLRAAGLPA